MKKYTCMDDILILLVMVIGLAEVAHFGALFLGWSISRCSILLAVGLVLLLIGVAIFRGLYMREKNSALGRFGVMGDGSPEKGCQMKKCLPFYLILALLVASQIVFIWLGEEIYRNGDMTVETVGSFLAHDGVYKVNPLTGNPYTAGIPLRLEILGLPTLYSVICYLTGIEPAVFVYKIVPAVVLLLSYLAFSVLGKSIFGQKKRERALFLVLVAVLFWIGTYMYGVDGFNLLCSGWRGVTIRNLVLMPWLFSLCKRKCYFGILLCLAAEVCLVWTLYGLGACLLVALGMLLAGKEKKA